MPVGLSVSLSGGGVWAEGCRGDRHGPPRGSGLWWWWGGRSTPEPCSPTPLSPAPPLPRPQDLKKYGATTVVRVCEVTYDKALLEKDGITVVVRLAGCCLGRGGEARGVLPGEGG